MTIPELQRLYEKAKTSDDIDDHGALTEALLESLPREAIPYHYELLRDRPNRDLYQWLRAKFSEWEAPGEAFLLQQIKREQDPLMVADCLQILGNMNSHHARDLAREYARSEVAEIRHVAGFVLGWVGTAEDVKTVMRDLTTNDPAALVRAHTATALRQVWYRKPAVKPSALRILAEALPKEEDTYAIQCMIITAQSIMKKRFGLRENVDEATIEGNVASAKKKALAALEKL